MDYLILKFGSVARGDTNPLSDEDLACIYTDSFKGFEKFKKKFPNITFYSTIDIINMKRKGSLFLTHLDRDGIIIDGNPNISNIYKYFTPQKNPLIENIKESKRFIYEINWIPNNRKGILWLNDVLYVLLRNIIYCSNAINNIYEFNYINALGSYKDSSSFFRLMNKIRNGKYIYRLDDKTDKEILPYANLLEIEKLLKNHFQISSKIILGGKTDFKKIELNYIGERILERSIINNEIQCSTKFIRYLKSHNYNKFNIRKELIKITSLYRDSV